MILQDLTPLICSKKEAVFCSSDKESIRMDDVLYEKITQVLQSAKVVIALITPNSLYRPWVLFETGGAHFFKVDGAKKNHKPLFLVYANGINSKSLPAPSVFEYPPTIIMERKKDRPEKRILRQRLAIYFGSGTVPSSTSFNRDRARSWAVTY